MSTMQAKLKEVDTYLCIWSAEQSLFVELADILCDIDYTVQFSQGVRIGLVVSNATAIVVCRKVGTYASDCPEEQDCVEVHVLQAFRVGRDTIDEAL